jgi:molecular chaperone GrpE
MQRIQETTLNDGLYEVMEVERPEGSDHEVVWLKEELAAERERGLRLLAEFDNYRRRTRQEHARAEEDGKREVLLPLLDLMDDFDRAILHIDEHRMQWPTVSA